jgi:hypothetical protein
MQAKDGSISHPVKSDYEAYAMAKSHEEKTYATRSISGITFLKMKGKNITITTNDEFDADTLRNSSVQPPKKWYARVLDTVDNTVAIGVPATLKGFWGWLAHDAFKYNQGKVAKDPVVVEQRLDTVTNNSEMVSSHDVEVVTEQELVIVEQPLVIETETNTNNSTNTTNNYAAPEVP